MGSGEKKHISPSLSAYSFADRKGRFGRHGLLFCSEHNGVVARKLFSGEEGEKVLPAYSYADRKGRCRRGILLFILRVRWRC